MTLRSVSGRCRLIEDGPKASKRVSVEEEEVVVVVAAVMVVAAVVGGRR